MFNTQYVNELMKGFKMDGNYNVSLDILVSLLNQLSKDTDNYSKVSAFIVNEIIKKIQNQDKDVVKVADIFSKRIQYNSNLHDTLLDLEIVGTLINAIMDCEEYRALIPERKITVLALNLNSCLERYIDKNGDLTNDLLNFCDNYLVVLSEYTDKYVTTNQKNTMMININNLKNKIAKYRNKLIEEAKEKGQEDIIEDNNNEPLKNKKIKSSNIKSYKE